MCAWSGGNFTRANPTWTSDANFGIGIEAGRHDAQDNDFTTGIDQCLNKTGQNSMTGDLNLGGYRPTNVAAGTAAAPALCVANDVNTGIFQAAAAPDTLSIATNSTERVRVDSSGRVGIGTTSPSARLDLGTNANGSAYFTATNGTDTNLQFSFSSQLSTITNGGGSGSLAFQTGGNFERMRIDSSGRVGIGVSNPTYTLDVDRGSSGMIAAFRSGAGRAAYIYGDASSVIIGSDTNLHTSMSLDESNDRLLFNTANVERMRIDSNGVGINVLTASTTLTVGGTFQPSAGAATNSGIIQIKESNITALNTKGGLEFYGSGSGSGYGSKIVGFDNGSMVFGYRNNSATWTESARIDNSGFFSALGSRNRTTALAANCHIDSTDGSIFRSTSSLKYKTDVRNYDKGLDAAVTLRPVYYKGKTNGDVEFAGLIAEEVHQAGFTEFVMYDEEGLPDALAYQNMVALLLNSIKDLNAKVEALEAKVENLEAVTAGL